MLEDHHSILWWRHPRDQNMLLWVFLFTAWKSQRMGTAQHLWGSLFHFLAVLRVNKQYLILSENLSCSNIRLLSVVLLPCRACPHPPSDFPAGTGILPSKWRPVFFLSVFTLLSHCYYLVVIQTLYFLGALFWVSGCLSDEVIVY